ncbi:MAG: hypothetical protein GY842_17360, partial [bacterium]|nr:hypothetical protein [bacterium]
EKIIPEYTEWMRQRWNHPCVVIWDAQNESNTAETGKALQAVRHLDLSDRPWENGWAEPQDLKDCVEAHPYLFIRTWSGKEPFRFEDIARTSGVPHLGSAQKKLDVPIIINEYAWLWLTRDGHPTCLTDKVYESLLGPNSTVKQRRLKNAQYLAALTEFWRCHRRCAGVLHFCGLGYSRPGDKPRPEGGATSDHFTNLKRLTFEPQFERYVRDSFAPVGLMLNYWGQPLPAGREQEFEVFVINDLPDDWSGQLKLRLLKSNRDVMSQERTLSLDSLGREILPFRVPLPGEPGDYTLQATLHTKGQPPVRSTRDMKVAEAK